MKNILYPILILFLFFASAFTLVNTNLETAPDFSFENEKGKTGKLDDLRGKVIYISFWASWCKPCIANFSKYSETRDALEEMGVIILNVSIDRNKADWLKAVDRYEPSGRNVRPIDVEKMKRDYDISSVPLYHIINKKGEFQYLTEGEDRDILAEFRRFLNE